MHENVLFLKTVSTMFKYINIEIILLSYLLLNFSHDPNMAKQVYT